MYKRRRTDSISTLTSYRRPVKSAVLNDLKGEKIQDDTLTTRKPSEQCSYSNAIRRFFAHRMPKLTLRTYGRLPFEWASGSAVQAVFSGLEDDYTIGSKDWCYRVLNKMQYDMVAQSNNTTDGLVANSLTDAGSNAVLFHQNGLSILNQTRTYTFMNTENCVGIVEIYEMVFKNIDRYEDSQAATGNNNYTLYNPASLWSKDLVADDPSWAANVTWPVDANVGRTTPGVRPKFRGTKLGKHWKLERHTKYVMPAGTSQSHVINIPATYYSADELAPNYVVTTGTTTRDIRDMIPGKTRCIMVITYGQYGFDGYNHATAASNIEYMPVTFNVRWRQYTTARIEEGGKRNKVFWTGCHDLQSSAVDYPEHDPLTTPTIIMQDAPDIVTVEDLDN